MRRFMTAVAAIALVAGAAHAQGQGHGGGGKPDRAGGGQQAHGSGGGKPDRAGNAGGERGGGMQMATAQRGGGGSSDRGNNERGQGGSDRDNRGAGNQGGGATMQAAGAPHEGGGRKERGSSGRNNGNGNRPGDLDRGRGNGGIVAERGRGNGAVAHDRWRDVDVLHITDFSSAPGRGLIAGCPPGLAKRNPPCVPPGQVRNRFPGYDRPDFWGLGLGDGRYWYDDGYLFRLGPDGRIGGFIPLLGGALAIGHVWPSFYQPVALPNYYESYYGLGPHSGYRYADNVIYRVDPESAAITSIAALLTGDDFVVGQPMPVGYDVYNVPYPYRAQYYDRPDALYRYSDGYIYQLDPETRLIAAAIELAVS